MYDGGEIKNSSCILLLVFFVLWPGAGKSLLVSACIIITQEEVEPPAFCSLFWCTVYNGWMMSLDHCS